MTKNSLWKWRQRAPKLWTWLRTDATARQIGFHHNRFQCGAVVNAINWDGSMRWRHNRCFDVLLTVHFSTFISVFNQLDAQNLFYNKFYFMPLHVSSIKQILCIKLVKYWDKLTNVFCLNYGRGEVKIKGINCQYLDLFITILGEIF
jgi:hypothetical protein